MSFERYANRFDRAVFVQGGRLTEQNLLTRDGQTVLRKQPRQVAPSVVTPVTVSGLARPGEVMTVTPGSYAGTPQPGVTRRLLRSGVADLALSTPSFTIVPEDLGKELTVVETATNSAGQVETRATVNVARIAPTAITASRLAAEVSADTTLPAVLATLSANGDAPLSWTMTGAPAGLALVMEGAQMRLVLTTLPPLGDYPVMIRAANSSGAASIAFALRMTAPAIEAPRQVTLSAGAVTLKADASLPRELAVLSAAGSQPLDWKVSGAGGAAQIDVTGSTPVLRLVSMPVPGQYPLTITAGNAAGTAAATFMLAVEAAAPAVVAPKTVTLSAARMTLVADAAVPVTLALVTADGTAPLTWSHDGDATVFAIEKTGTGMALVLRSMPAAGSRAVTVTARNAAGAASARFDLTVSAAAPVVVAPTAVTLSATSASLRADATVPATLATLSANGTQPVTWSLPNGPAWAAIDTSGAQPALRLTAMPPVGTYNVNVRATNASGMAEATFALAVAAVPVNTAPGTLVTASTGTITASRTNADGSVTFTLLEGTVSTAYTIPAATVQAGYAALLVLPTVTADGQGNFSVTKPALVVAPATDPAVVTYDWQVDGRSTGITGDSFAWRDASDKARRIEMVACLTNLAMTQAGAATRTPVLAQAAPVLVYQPMTFNAPERDQVTFTSPSVAKDYPSALLYTRFRLRPDATDTNLMGVIAQFGPSYIEMSGSSALNMRQGMRTADPALHGYADITSLAGGDLMDVFMLFGRPYGVADARRSFKLRVLRNGVPALPDQNRVMSGSFNGVPTDSVIRHAASETWKLGGQGGGGPADGGLSHIQFRTFYGPGLIAASLDEMQAQFLDSAGNLVHPDVARGMFGVPLIDFFNSTNSGTLGAPTTASVLA